MLFIYSEVNKSSGKDRRYHISNALSNIEVANDAKQGRWLVDWNNSHFLFF